MPHTTTINNNNIQLFPGIQHIVVIVVFMNEVNSNYTFNSTQYFCPHYPDFDQLWSATKSSQSSLCLCKVSVWKAELWHTGANLMCHDPTIISEAEKAHVRACVCLWQVALLGGGFLECVTIAGQDVSNCYAPQQQVCFLYAFERKCACSQACHFW